MAKQNRFYNNGKSAMKEGAGMIKDDPSANCLLPREVMEKSWGSGYNYLNLNINSDLYTGVEKQMDKDNKDMRREFKASKY